MPNYRYRAMNSNGELVSAVIAAPAPGDVAARIERLGLVLVDSVTLEEGGSAVGTVCVYQASSPEAIHEHASRAGLPVDEIIRVADTVIVRPDPEGAAA